MNAEDKYPIIEAARQEVDRLDSDRRVINAALLENPQCRMVEYSDQCSVCIWRRHSESSEGVYLRFDVDDQITGAILTQNDMETKIHFNKRRTVLAFITRTRA